MSTPAPGRKHGLPHCTIFIHFSKMSRKRKLCVQLNLTQMTQVTQVNKHVPWGYHIPLDRWLHIRKRHLVVHQRWVSNRQGQFTVSVNTLSKLIRDTLISGSKTPQHQNRFLWCLEFKQVIGWEWRWGRKVDLHRMCVVTIGYTGVIWTAFPAL
jgi:hypothetical protein